MDIEEYNALKEKIDELPLRWENDLSEMLNKSDVLKILSQATETEISFDAAWRKIAERYPYGTPQVKEAFDKFMGAKNREYDLLIEDGKITTILKGSFNKQPLNLSLNAAPLGKITTNLKGSFNTEHEEIEIPKFVAEIIEDAGGTSTDSAKEYVIRSVIEDYYSEEWETYVQNWFGDYCNILKFYRAVENGYKTKEPVYLLKVPYVSGIYYHFYDGNIATVTKDNATEFTKSKINQYFPELENTEWVEEVEE